MGEKITGKYLTDRLYKLQMILKDNLDMMDEAGEEIIILRTKIAAKDAEIADHQETMKELGVSVVHWNKRADAAEARVKELEKEQKPTGYHDVDEFYQDGQQPTPEDRIAALELELESAEARISTMSLPFTGIMAENAALELELAATHERARALDRNLTIKSDELAEAKGRLREVIGERDTAYSEVKELENISERPHSYKVLCEEIKILRRGEIELKTQLAGAKKELEVAECDIVNSLNRRVVLATTIAALERELDELGDAYTDLQIDHIRINGQLAKAKKDTAGLVGLIAEGAEAIYNIDDTNYYKDLYSRLRAAIDDAGKEDGER